jgi:PKD repeat protein
MSTIQIKPGGGSQGTKDDPTATVVADPAVFTKPGKYTFSLVVTDSEQIDSEAATVVVEVRGQPIARVTGPKTVAFGKAIDLNGKESTPADANTPITTYTWSVTGPA